MSSVPQGLSNRWIFRHHMRIYQAPAIAAAAAASVNLVTGGAQLSSTAGFAGFSPAIGLGGSEKTGAESSAAPFLSSPFSFSSAWARSHLELPTAYRLGRRHLLPSPEYCFLTPESLSFCDFFGGVLCLWVTATASAAMPSRYAEVSCLFAVLVLTVAVQVIRYSVGLFLAPLAVGGLLVVYHWVSQFLSIGKCDISG